jgi:hypothetical protein
MAYKQNAIEGWLHVREALHNHAGADLLYSLLFNFWCGLHVTGLCVAVTTMALSISLFPRLQVLQCQSGMQTIMQLA